MSSPSSAPADGFQAITIGPTQTVAITVASASSTVLDCSVVRLYCTQDVFIKISQAGTAATTSDMLLPATSVEYFICHKGDFVTGIRASADGTLYVTQGA